MRTQVWNNGSCQGRCAWQLVVQVFRDFLRCLMARLKRFVRVKIKGKDRKRLSPSTSGVPDSQCKM